MDNKQKNILIVEDEKNIADILLFNIQVSGYGAKAVYDGKSGLDEALTGNYDLVLLDLMLPVMDGFEVCAKIREKLDVPIIILTARAEERDKITGLDLGADDYMTKPFSIDELKSRIKANIRRYSNELVTNKISDAQIVIGDITIDCESYLVKKGDAILELSKKEYELLAFLAKNAGKVYSRDELIIEVWGYDPTYGDQRTVDVTVARLRKKVEGLIQTKHGMGYYINKN
jgi:two-component system response regulator VicR